MESVNYHCCCCSVTKLCPTLCNPMDCSMPGLPVLHHLPEFAQTHVHWIDDVIQTFHPLPPSSPSAFSLSQHQGFFPMSQLFTSGGQNYWSFIFTISPSSEYSELIFFRIDWFDLPVQETLKSLLQHHSLKASILSLILDFSSSGSKLFFKSSGKDWESDREGVGWTQVADVTHSDLAGSPSLWLIEDTGCISKSGISHRLSWTLSWLFVRLSL